MCFYRVALTANVSRLLNLTTRLFVGKFLPGLLDLYASQEDPLAHAARCPPQTPQQVY